MFLTLTVIDGKRGVKNRSLSIWLISNLLGLLYGTICLSAVNLKISDSGRAKELEELEELHRIISY